MEDAYIIHGGKPLKGNVILSGAKNVALKTIIAALLFDQEVTLQNIPDIGDVRELMSLILFLGGKAKFTDKNVLKVDGRNIKINRVNLLHGSKIRVSFMLFAPLLHKFGEAHIPNPGGCRLGARSIDRVVEGMKTLGVHVDYDSSTGYYHATLEQGKQVSGTYTFAKPSHTATELMIMLGVYGKDTVCIENAALEPEIDDLIEFLNRGGAQIKRNGATIEIKGIQSLHQTEPYHILSDRIEAITYAVIGIVTNGDVIISGIRESLMLEFIRCLKEAGGGVEKIDETTWRFFKNGELKPVNVTTSPYPGFMTDWQPLWAVLMTQALGNSVIHERIYENRFSYVEEMSKLGSHIEYEDIKVEDPASFYHFNYDSANTYKQAIKIFGPQKFHNGVVKIADMRAGATLAIAALMAEGESVVMGCSMVERGYENFVEKLRKLGGDIRAV